MEKTCVCEECKKRPTSETVNIYKVNQKRTFRRIVQRGLYTWDAPYKKSKKKKKEVSSEYLTGL